MRRDMNFKNYDVALITDEKQRMYFLGFHSTAGYVLITKEKTYFVVDNRYLKAAEKALPLTLELRSSLTSNAAKQDLHLRR